MGYLSELSIYTEVCYGIVVPREHLKAVFVIDFHCEIADCLDGEEGSVADDMDCVVLRLMATVTRLGEMEMDVIDPADMDSRSDERSVLHHTTKISTLTTPFFSDALVQPALRSALSAAYRNIVKPPHCDAAVTPPGVWLSVMTTVGFGVQKFRGEVEVDSSEGLIQLRLMRHPTWTPQTHWAFTRDARAAIVRLLLALCRLQHRGDVACMDPAVVQEMLGHYHGDRE